MGRSFKSEHQTEPNKIIVPRLAEINLTQGHQFFQKEERDISALLSELEEGVTVMSGDGDTEDSRRPYPIPLRRLVEEAVTRRESTRRETHLTWVTAGVILLLTVQLLSVSTLIYRAVGGVWRNLVSRRNTNSAPTTRSGEQTNTGTSTAFHNRQAERVDNPPDAAYPDSSDDVAATPNQRFSMARDDAAAAGESETALYNAHGQIRVCMSAR